MAISSAGYSFPGGVGRGGAGISFFMIAAGFRAEFVIMALTVSAGTDGASTSVSFFLKNMFTPIYPVWMEIKP